MPIVRVKAKIGELLLKKGLIKQEQLQEALSLQASKDKGKPLGQILVELGYVDKEELFGFLAVQKGCPYININNYRIEPTVLSLIPEAMVRKYKVLPIDKIQDVFTIAMVNPLDIMAIDQIQKLTDTNVKVFLTTPLELKEAILRYYDKERQNQS